MQIAFILLTLVLAVLQVMSLKAFRSISCRVLGHGGCECNPMVSLTALRYCSTSSTPTNIPTKSIKVKPLRPLPSSLVVPSRSFSATKVSSTGKSDVLDKTTNTNQSSTQNQQLSLKDKLKTLWKQYGLIAVGTYLSIYVATLSSMFVALDWDIFNAATFGLDPMYAIQKVMQYK
jgi:hypothetical protein